jgi:tellurium resistance protein TerD
MSPQVDKIVFPVSIYDAEGRNQNFGQVVNAFIRVVTSHRRELTRFDLSEDASHRDGAGVSASCTAAARSGSSAPSGQGYASGLPHRPRLRRQRLTHLAGERAHSVR